MMENSSKRVESTVGKGEIARYSVSKDLHRKHIKTRTFKGE